MTTYNVTCIKKRKKNGHDHIYKIGTGRKNTKIWKVRYVLEAIVNGDNFVIIKNDGTSTLNEYSCDCGYKTLRSTLDGIEDDNLEKLPECDN